MTARSTGSAAPARELAEWRDFTAPGGATRSIATPS